MRTLGSRNEVICLRASAPALVRWLEDLRAAQLVVGVGVESSRLNTTCASGDLSLPETEVAIALAIGVTVVVGTADSPLSVPESVAESSTSAVWVFS